MINLEILKRPGDNIKETTLSLLENVTIFWSTNIHMKLTLLMRDMKEFLDTLNQELEIENETVKNQCIQHLRVMAQTECHLEISQDHKAKISLGKYYISLLF